ncbi:MAG: serine protease Do [Verrucomicrobiales bacterium]|jgi:serine protease Do
MPANIAPEQGCAYLFPVIHPRAQPSTRPARSSADSLPAKAKRQTFLWTIVAAISLPTSFVRADSIQAFRDRQEKVKAVAEAAITSTVAITSSQASGTGSGVIISAEGLILTAAHVTEATGKELTITFADGREVTGMALGSNRTIDAGLARITEEGPWPHSTIGQSDVIPMGTWCIAMGHPGGFNADRPPPVRLGRIWHRDQYGALYSDCTLIGGDSGGPLFDLEGRVIGIHSSIGGSLSTNRHAAIDSYRQHWDRMLMGEIWGKLHLDPDKGDLATMGIALDWNSQDGALVRAVRKMAPAAEAGIQAGDIIIQFAGEPIASSIQLLRKLSEMKAGDLASVAVTRHAEVVDLEVTLTDYKSLTTPPAPLGEAQPDAPYLGIETGEMIDGAGVRIDQVFEDSPAAKAGIIIGDIITAIDDTAVDSPEILIDEILRRQPDSSVTLHLIRDESSQSVTVKLGHQ